MTRARSAAKALLPFSTLFVLSLSACNKEEEKQTYEAGVKDVGGGDLIVTEQDPNAAPVETPDTPMTPVPPAAESPAPAPSPSETPE